MRSPQQMQEKIFDKIQHSFNVKNKYSQQIKNQKKFSQYSKGIIPITTTATTTKQPQLSSY